MQVATHIIMKDRIDDMSYRLSRIAGAEPGVRKGMFSPKCETISCCWLLGNVRTTKKRAAPIFVTRIADAKQYDRITDFLCGFSQEKKRLVSNTIVAIAKK
jgi:hypothetical protein